MTDITLSRKETSPEVNFLFSENHLSMTGEAYPEDAHEFFNPILKPLEDYLSAAHNLVINFDFHLTYFNSAATKMLYVMFEMLNDAAFAGNTVNLNWYHDEEDDTSLEFGEGVAEDCPSLNFTAIATV